MLWTEVPRDKAGPLAVCDDPMHGYGCFHLEEQDEEEDGEFASYSDKQLESEISLAEARVSDLNSEIDEEYDRIEELRDVLDARKKRVGRAA